MNEKDKDVWTGAGLITLMMAMGIGFFELYTFMGIEFTFASSFVIFSAGALVGACIVFAMTLISDKDVKSKPNSTNQGLRLRTIN